MRLYLFNQSMVTDKRPIILTDRFLIARKTVSDQIPNFRFFSTIRPRDDFRQSNRAANSSDRPTRDRSSQ